jgi:hypothetical protein
MSSKLECHYTRTVIKTDMSSKLKFHQKIILTKNLRHGAKNVWHSAKNVRHGAKNVRPIDDVSNSLGTVGRDERRCLSYPMTQIA